ncbi:hypothetical protein Q7A53_05210 [Halobacillus rhizosphaerae]|uniref:hypothetical protein n=1 Tax=Halobacillus rhizosphaerae TaxID=3064889 RepID=UPI00398B2BE4
MAKVYKAGIYLIDANDDLDIENIKHALENLGYELWVGFEIATLKESKEFEWDDELKINQNNATISDYEEYFKKDECEDGI